MGCYCYCAGIPIISAQKVSFKNTSQQPIALFWISELCDSEHYILPNTCFANIIEPGDTVSYYYKDEHKVLKLAFFSIDHFGRETICFKNVSPGHYESKDLEKSPVCYLKKSILPEPKKSKKSKKSRKT